MNIADKKDLTVLYAAVARAAAKKALVGTNTCKNCGHVVSLKTAVIERVTECPDCLQPIPNFVIQYT